MFNYARGVFFIFLSLIYFPGNIFSQQQASDVREATVINGKIIFERDQDVRIFTKAYLGSYIGKDFKILDSAAIQADFTFILKTSSNPHEGTYEIGFGNDLGMPIVVTNRDSKLDVEVKFINATSIELPKFNIENVVLSNLSRSVKNVNIALSEIQRARSGFPKDDKWQWNMDSLTRLSDSMKIAFNQRLFDFSTTNSETYAGDIIAKILYLPDVGTDIRSVSSEKRIYMQEHFLDKFPFNDERIIYNPFIADKILYYVGNYSLREPEGFKKCVDEVLGRASANPEVKKFVLQLLLDAFIERGPEEVLFYIADNYVEGCSNGLPEVTIKRIKQLRNFRPGVPAPPINLPDTANNVVSLTAACKGNPAIVYFWSPSCGHCLEETPKYVALHQKFRDKGLKVYAVSLGDTKAAWIEVIRKEKLNWINVSDFKKFDSPDARAYHVFATPAVFLLDGEGKFILVNPAFEEVQQWADKFFR